MLKQYEYSAYEEEEAGYQQMKERQQEPEQEEIPQEEIINNKVNNMENKRKEGWEAYIHDNGTLQVKRYCEGIVEIELDSPFVKCYLGTLLNTNKKFYSREEAEEYFKNNNKKGK